MYISTVCTFVCNLNDVMCVCVFALILEHSCLGCLGDAAYHVIHTSKPILFSASGSAPFVHATCKLNRSLFPNQINCYHLPSYLCVLMRVF